MRIRDSSAGLWECEARNNLHESFCMAIIQEWDSLMVLTDLPMALSNALRL